MHTECADGGCHFRRFYVSILHFYSARRNERKHSLRFMTVRASGMGRVWETSSVCPRLRGNMPYDGGAGCRMRRCNDPALRRLCDDRGIIWLSLSDWDTSGDSRFDVGGTVALWYHWCARHFRKISFRYKIKTLTYSKDTLRRYFWRYLSGLLIVNHASGLYCAVTVAVSCFVFMSARKTVSSINLLLLLRWEGKSIVYIIIVYK